jgi:hypothetical protein
MPTVRRRSTRHLRPSSRMPKPIYGSPTPRPAPLPEHCNAGNYFMVCPFDFRDRILTTRPTTHTNTALFHSGTTTTGIHLYNRSNWHHPQYNDTHSPLKLPSPSMPPATPPAKRQPCTHIHPTSLQSSHQPTPCHMPIECPISTMVY